MSMFLLFFKYEVKLQRHTVHIQSAYSYWALCVTFLDISYDMGT